MSDVEIKTVEAEPVESPPTEAPAPQETPKRRGGKKRTAEMLVALESGEITKTLGEQGEVEGRRRTRSSARGTPYLPPLPKRRRNRKSTGSEETPIKTAEAEKPEEVEQAPKENNSISDANDKVPEPKQEEASNSTGDDVVKADVADSTPDQEPAVVEAKDTANSVEPKAEEKKADGPDVPDSSTEASEVSSIEKVATANTDTSDLSNGDTHAESAAPQNTTPEGEKMDSTSTE